MGIDITKGGRVDLNKQSPGLKRVRIGLGWNPNGYTTGAAFDLDASVFVCKANDQAPAGCSLISDQHFVFFNNLKDPEQAVVHSGDNRTGDAAGDDETIVIDLAKLNAQASEISFIVTIHDAAARKQNFGQVAKSYIKLYDDESGAEIAKYALDDDFHAETAVQFGSLYKKDSGWMFKAVGAGYDKGLGDFVQIYGGNLK